ncbi:MAG: hypothetical protein Q8Q39_01540 [bacterium]|nr:hypothetical protein [bacterium]
MESDPRDPFGREPEENKRDPLEPLIKSSNQRIDNELANLDDVELLARNPRGLQESLGATKLATNRFTRSGELEKDRVITQKISVEHWEQLSEEQFAAKLSEEFGKPDTRAIKIANAEDWAIVEGDRTRTWKVLMGSDIVYAVGRPRPEGEVAHDKEAANDRVIASRICEALGEGWEFSHKAKKGTANPNADDAALYQWDYRPVEGQDGTYYVFRKKKPAHNDPMA